MDDSLGEKVGTGQPFSTATEGDVLLRRPTLELKQILRSSLVRSSVIYTVSTVVNSAIPFLIMPVLTRYLTPVDYGIASMVAVLVGVATPFIGLNIHGAISVKYFDRTHHDIPRYIGNCFILLFASTAAVSGLVWLFSGAISAFTAVPRNWLAAVVVIATCQFVVLVLLTLWQVRDNAARYGTFQVLQTVLNITLTILLVVVLRMNWKGRIEAQLLSLLAGAAVAAVLLWKGRWIKLSYNRNDLRHALKFGVPLIPHALGAMLMTQTDRLFITNMVSVADTGIYTVGFQLAMVVELCASSFNRAYVPWLYSRLAKDDAAEKRTIVKLTYVYFAGILLFAVALSLFVPLLLSFFVGKSFVGAGKYTPWIALAFAFSGMYYMVANYIFYAGATHVLAGITFVMALTNIVFNYVFIKINGPVGAAQASALASLLTFVLAWILSAKVYRMPWNLLKVVNQ